MAPAKGVIASIPEMEAVAPEKEALIDEFIRLLKQKFPETLPLFWARLEGKPNMRIMAYKFLTARKWTMDAALEMAFHTVAWREHHGLNNLPLFPCAFPAYGYDTDDVLQVLGAPRRAENDWYGKAFALTQPVYQSGYQYWDRQGHPILIMNFGKCTVKSLFQRYQQLCNVGEKATHASTKAHMYENEVGNFLVEYRDAVNAALPAGHPDKVDRRILGITAVIDCDGLGYGHLWNPILDVVKCQFAVDAAHYPEGLHRVLVVNCPSMIKFAYTIVKSVIDPRVQQKIVFCRAGDETRDTMRLLVDPKYLPEHLGGEWVMPDGKPWGGARREGETPTSEDQADSDAKTEDINVPAGKTLKKEYRLGKGEELAWEFVSTTGSDIKFGVQFIPDGSSVSKVIASEDRIKDDADRFTASEAGVVVLLWDNSFSWMRSKQLQMKIIKSAAADISEELN